MSFSVHPQQPEEGREDRGETQGANGEAAKGPCRHHCYKKTFLPQCFLNTELAPTWAAPVPESH